MFVPATLVLLLAIPLALKLVPPNRIYGFRTALALANRDLWFSINRIAGFALIAASSVALAIYFYQPELASGHSYAGVLVLIVPVLLALAGTGIVARRLAGRSD